MLTQADAGGCEAAAREQRTRRKARRAQRSEGIGEQTSVWETFSLRMGKSFSVTISFKYFLG